MIQTHGHAIRTLIVEDEKDLAALWQRHLERNGAKVTVVSSETEAIDAVRAVDFAVIIVDLELAKGNPFSFVTYAGVRRPDARVVCVTNQSFFSNGSLFQYFNNAAVMTSRQTDASDLAVMVRHHARRWAATRPSDGPGHAVPGNSVRDSSG